MKSRFQWKYVLPNVVTCVGLSLGILSISMALQGRTLNAAWLIVVCVLLDKLDGTVARALNATSNFGLQMDSFSDLVTFGVAPTVLLLASSAGLGDSVAPVAAETPAYRTIATTCATIYVVCAALRLARFNILPPNFGKGHFFGIPSTMAGALLAGAYLTIAKYGAAEVFYYLMPPAYFLGAVLMVSNVPLAKLRRTGVLPFDLLQLANIILVYVIGFTWFLVPEEWWYPEYLLALALTYVVVGVPWALAKGVRAPRVLETHDAVSVAEDFDEETAGEAS